MGDIDKEGRLKRGIVGGRGEGFLTLSRGQRHFPEGEIYGEGQAHFCEESQNFRGRNPEIAFKGRLRGGPTAKVPFCIHQPIGRLKEQIMAL